MTHDQNIGDLYFTSRASERRDLGTALEKVWIQQRAYNGTILNQEGTDDPSEWTQTYLLGLVSEIDEVLRELHWKRHRRDSGRVIRSNLARELADLTKYVFSLWQIWGWTPEAMLKYVEEKNDVLAAQLYQDQNERMPFVKTVMFDLDGTVADYRAGLELYLNANTGASDIRRMFYQMDLATQLDFEIYHQYKDEFEENGGYRTLPPYRDATTALRLIGKQANLCAVTARPKYLGRIWADTWYWLKEHIRVPQRLWLAGGERLSLAKKLRAEGYAVIAWEDSPIEALRFAEHGFETYMRSATYNDGIYAPTHPLIHRVEEFSADIESYNWREE